MENNSVNLTSKKKKIWYNAWKAECFFRPIPLSESVNALVDKRTFKIKMLLEMKENCDEFYEVTRYIPIAIVAFWEYFFKVTYYMLLKNHYVTINEERKTDFSWLKVFREKNAATSEEFFWLDENKFAAVNRNFLSYKELNNFITEAFIGHYQNELLSTLKASLESIINLRHRFAHESYFVDQNYIKLFELDKKWENIESSIRLIQNFCNVTYEGVLGRPIQDFPPNNSII